jgi:hypothetical protein
MILRWNQDDFDANGEEKTIAEDLALTRWGNWRINGSVEVYKGCPAEAVSQEVGGKRDTLAAMRKFRDEGAIKKNPGLAHWWSFAAEHIPEFLHLMRRDDSLREIAAQVLAAMPSILKKPDAPLPPNVAKHIEQAVGIVARESRRSLRGIAQRLQKILIEQRGKTLNQTLGRLSNAVTRSQTHGRRSARK